jgi:hypothetical protein
MKRVIVLPLVDVARFPDLEVVALDRNLAALVGPTVPGRMREAYDSDDAFLEAVSYGFADRHTFQALDDAAAFASWKLEDLARQAKEVEDAIAARLKLQPVTERSPNGLAQTFQQRKHA